MDKTVSNVTAIKKYNIVHSKKLGRYMVAAKNLTAGETIFHENALAIGPAAIVGNTIFCFACMRPLPGFYTMKNRCVCSRCNVAPLCNRACENADGLHSLVECNIFRENKNLSIDNIEELVKILLHFRLWILKDTNQDAWDKLSNMESHVDKRRDTSVWHDRQKNIVDVFRKFELSCNDEAVQQLCGVVDVNTFELRTPGGPQCEPLPLLRGLFLEAALMAHSCRGSAHITVDDNFRMAVYAAVPIAIGESISFNYTSSLLGTIERQEHLLEGKYFRCHCDACNDPFEGGSHLSSILCPRCKKDYLAIQKPHDNEPFGKKSKWQCNKCKRIYSGCLVKSTIEISRNLISELDKTNYKAMEILLEKLCKTFHKNHFVIISLKQKMLAVSRKELSTLNPSKKMLEKMVDHCKDILNILDIVEPGISRLKGIILYEIHLPITILANRAYTTREISISELFYRLEEARAYLKRSLTMLLLEPATTPEGLLAKRALQEMKMLTQNVEDAKALTSHENSVVPLRNHRQRKIK